MTRRPFSGRSGTLSISWCRLRRANIRWRIISRVGRDAGALCSSDDMPDLGNATYQVLASGLFDVDFYAETYPDVATASTDLFMHYMATGYKEGRVPNLLLDVEYYLAQVPEAEREDLNPLMHFYQRGAAQDLNPNYFFDTAWYKAEYPECAAEGINPLAYFNRDGGRTTNPSPRFDAAWYLAQHEDVAAGGHESSQTLHVDRNG